MSKSIEDRVAYHARKVRELIRSPFETLTVRQFQHRTNRLTKYQMRVEGLKENK